jgi:hypothetical protein
MGAAVLLMLAASSHWYHTTVAREGMLPPQAGAGGSLYAAAPVAKATWAGSHTFFGLIVLVIGLAVLGRVLVGASPRWRLPTRLERIGLEWFLVAASAAAILATLAGLFWRPEVAAVPAVAGEPAGVALSLGLPLTLLAALAIGALGCAMRPRRQRPTLARVYRFPSSGTRGNARRNTRPM